VKTTLGAYPTFQNAIFCLQNEVGTPQNAVYRHFKSTFCAFSSNYKCGVGEQGQAPGKKNHILSPSDPRQLRFYLTYILTYFLAYIPTFILTDKEDEDEEGGGGGEGEGVAPPLNS
jgi:hypothetical protein